MRNGCMPSRPGVATRQSTCSAAVACRLLAGPRVLDLLQLRDPLGGVVKLLQQRLKLLFSEPLHAALGHRDDLDVLPGGLRDLEQALERQTHRSVVVHVLGVLLLEEVLDALGVLPDGGRLPRVVGARRVRLEQRSLAFGVKASDQRGDAKRPHTAPVRVLLLGPGDETGDVVDRGGVLDVETVRLALDAHLVHENAGIRVESRKGKGDVVVAREDLPNCPRVLELGGGALLDRQDHDVLSSHTYGRGSLADGLEGVLDLEKVPVRREDCDRPIVATRHCCEGMRWSSH
mmetsp:Transcript_8594/g.25342  ORF Transcript_8594/g.25342 Transcript_8594/m.25342 type:complete len:289 (+) Transcript_8594:44-910(+)